MMSTEFSDDQYEKISILIQSVLNNDPLYYDHSNACYRCRYCDSIIGNVKTMPMWSHDDNCAYILAMRIGENNVR